MQAVLLTDVWLITILTVEDSSGMWWCDWYISTESSTWPNHANRWVLECTVLMLRIGEGTPLEQSPQSSCMPTVIAMHILCEYEPVSILFKMRKKRLARAICSLQGNWAWKQSFHNFHNRKMDPQCLLSELFLQWEIFCFTGITGSHFFCPIPFCTTKCLDSSCQRQDWVSWHNKMTRLLLHNEMNSFSCNTQRLDPSCITKCLVFSVSSDLKSGDEIMFWYKQNDDPETPVQMRYILCCGYLKLRALNFPSNQPFLLQRSSPWMTRPNNSSKAHPFISLQRNDNRCSSHMTEHDHKSIDPKETELTRKVQKLYSSVVLQCIRNRSSTLRTDHVPCHLHSVSTRHWDRGYFLSSLQRQR